MPRLVPTAAVILSTLMTAAAPTTAAAEDEYYDLMKVFVDTFEQIDRNYVKDVDKRELVDAAVRGMLIELDPYSNYIAPDQLADFTENIEQEFGGIGVQVNFDRSTKSLEVVAPLPGSPAFGVGLRTGDRIVEVNGTRLSEFAAGTEQAEALKRLRGPAGEPVEVGVFRPDAIAAATPGDDAGNVDQASDATATEASESRATDPAEESEDDGLIRFQIVRDKIQLPTVFGDRRISDGEWDYILPHGDGDAKIAYVRLTSFTRRSAEEMTDAMQAIVDADADGLILDLRDNPGGLLTSAAEIVDLFLETGLIVRTEGRNTPPRKWSAHRANTYASLPLVVLINRYSASASEITAAALQDHDRATVIGTRSFGKGSVQNVIDLEGGSAALKLTTASYYRPSGKNIHRFPDAKAEDDWGVRPNDGYEVEMTPAQMAKVREAHRKTYEMPEARIEVEDPVLDRAVEEITKKIDDNTARLRPAA